VRIADLQDTTLIAGGSPRCAMWSAPVPPTWPGTASRRARRSSLARLPGLCQFAHTRAPGVRRYRRTGGRVQVRAHLPANNGDCLRQVAEDGYGIVMGPSFILYQSIEGEDCSRSSRTTVPTLHAYAVYPSTRHLSRRVRTFLGRLPGWRRQPQPLAGPRPRSPSPLHVDGFARSREPWGYRRRPSPPRT